MYDIKYKWRMYVTLLEQWILKSACAVVDSGESRNSFLRYVHSYLSCNAISYVCTRGCSNVRM